MPSSSRILRGLAVSGWKTYYPRQDEDETLAGEKGGLPPEDAPATAEPLLPSVEEIEAEREAVLEEARRRGEAERQKILARAREEAAKLQQQAQKEGYAQGLGEGEKVAGKIKDEAVKLREEAHRQYEKILTDAEPEMIRIAVGLAEKLLDCQLDVNENLIVGIVSRSLDALTGGQEVVVRVNPRDEAVCREKQDLFRGLLKGDTVLEVRGDVDIQPGCCRVDTDESEITFNLARELQALLRKLLDLATP